MIWMLLFAAVCVFALLFEHYEKKHQAARKEWELEEARRDADAKAIKAEMAKLSPDEHAVRILQRGGHIYVGRGTAGKPLQNFPTGETPSGPAKTDDSGRASG